MVVIQLRVICQSTERPDIISSSWNLFRINSVPERERTVLQIMQGIRV
jgi:hypothetical protein